MGELVDLAQPLHVDVGVDLRGRDSGVAEHLLYGAQVRAPAEQVGREGMAWGMRRNPLGDSGPFSVPLRESPDLLPRNPTAKPARKQRRSRRQLLPVMRPFTQASRCGRARRACHRHNSSFPALTGTAQETMFEV